MAGIHTYFLNKYNPFGLERDLFSHILSLQSLQSLHWLLISHTYKPPHSEHSSLDTAFSNVPVLQFLWMSGSLLLALFSTIQSSSAFAIWYQFHQLESRVNHSWGLLIFGPCIFSLLVKFISSILTPSGWQWWLVVNQALSYWYQHLTTPSVHAVSGIPPQPLDEIGWAFHSSQQAGSTVPFREEAHTEDKPFPLSNPKKDFLRTMRLRWKLRQEIE